MFGRLSTSIMHRGLESEPKNLGLSLPRFTLRPIWESPQWTCHFRPESVAKFKQRAVIKDGIPTSPTLVLPVDGEASVFIDNATAEAARRRPYTGHEVKSGQTDQRQKCSLSSGGRVLSIFLGDRILNDRVQLFDCYFLTQEPGGSRSRHGLPIVIRRVH